MFIRQTTDEEDRFDTPLYYRLLCFTQSVLNNDEMLNNDEINIPILVEDRHMLQELHPLDVNVDAQHEGVVKRENLTDLLNEL